MKTNKFKTIYMLVILAIIPLWASNAGAATINAASCSQTDVQSAINSSASGDKVNVPGGSCSWSSSISWTNKNVAVIGAGKDVTNITCANCFSIISTASTSQYSQWRISNMTLSNSSQGGTVIKLWDNISSWKYGWRIDHIKFNFPAGAGNGIFIGGTTYGLIDHNDFIWASGIIINVSALQNNEDPSTASNPKGAYINSLPLDMGTANAVYIEDNTVTSASGCAIYDTSSGGGRTVFRYNTVTGCMYYDHWTRAEEIGGILHEIYNNKFVGNSGYNSYPIRLESGTGVIFNNTMQMADNYVLLDERRGFMESAGGLGACDGTKSWDGNAGDPSAPGWPCLGQIGRAPGKTMAQTMAGSKQVSAPLYIWNNGAQDGCRTGGACTNSFGALVYDGSTKAQAYVKATPHPNGEVDYVLNGSTPKPGYTPYTYPHPLQAGGGGSTLTPLLPATNLRIVP